MRSLLPLDPTSPVPLWAQLADGLRALIASGQIAPGEAIPSVRELARGLGINPATAARACRVLADEGLVRTRRGAGSVVVEQPARVADERARALAEAARAYAARCRALGVDAEDAAKALEAAWDEASRRDGRTR